jgi:hypothetical protein
MTANAIEDAQRSKDAGVEDITVVQLQELREQDFGSLECLPWSSKQLELTADKLPRLEDVGFKPKETSEAMARRANVFLDNFILPQLVVEEGQENTVAVVSHGLMLTVLWKSLLARFSADTISVGRDVSGKPGSRPLEYLPGWSNTGYLEIDLTHTHAPDEAYTPSTGSSLSPEDNPRPTKSTAWKMVVRNVNSKAHLSNLKRTGGGLGSSTYDARQKNVESYFKKPKIATQD